MARRYALLLLLLATSACNLSPPCSKAARIICEAGKGEQDSCAFLLNRGTDDRKAQEVCEEILPAAKALGADPKDESARDGWKQARETLAGIGFRADPGRGDIGNKLVKAGGIAGKVVENLRDHTKEAEEKTQQGAEKALQGEGQ